MSGTSGTRLRVARILRAADEDVLHSQQVGRNPANAGSSHPAPGSRTIGKVQRTMAAGKDLPVVPHARQDPASAGAIVPHVPCSTASSSSSALRVVKRLWEWGKAPASAVVEAEDGTSTAKNAARDVLRKRRRQAGGPEVYSADIDVWDEKAAAPSKAVFLVLLPHEVADHLVEGSASAAEWTDVEPERGLYTVRQNWCIRTGFDKPHEEVAGFGIWGDSAGYHTRDSIFLLLWNFVTGVHNKRFWFAVYPKRLLCRCGCHGRCTLEALFKVLLWSMRVLYTGVCPEKRHDGQPFKDSKRIGDQARAACWAAGRRLRVRGGVMQLRGDWSWYKQAFGLQGWGREGQTHRCCYKCQANYGTIPFTDASLTAAWRATVYNNETFMQQMVLNTFVSVLFALPGFVADYISIDLMHTGDLGIVKTLLGNVLWELFREFGGLVTRDAPVIAAMIAMIRTASKALKQKRYPMTNLTLNMIRPKGKGPELKVNAGEARLMLPVVLYMLDHFRLPGALDTEHQRVRRNCVHQLNSFYNELEQWRPDSGPRAAEFARRHAILFEDLWRQAGQGVLWRPHPKHHLFVHLAEDQIAIAGNPRECWCYADERAIAGAVRITESSNVLSIQRRCMCKYIATGVSI